MKQVTSRVLICVALAAIGFAQTTSRPAQLPESSRKLIAITVTGSKRFATPDVILASGLQIGTIAGDEEFKKAARQLGDTGAFSDISYSFSFTSAGTKLEWQVTDAEKFVPAHFEDFVWFTDDQLQQIIKDHVPLFTGELPLQGNMVLQVSDALQTQLVQKGVPGTVEWERISHKDGPVEAINFTVFGNLVRIRNIEFSGASAPELPLLEAAAQRVPDRGYSRTQLEAFAQRDLLPIYHSHGCLKATFGAPQPKVVSTTSPETGEENRNTTLVDVTLPVTPGPVYKFSAIQWSGNQVIPTQKLQPMIHAQTGQAANKVQLGNDLSEVRDLYGSKGYIAATIKADAQFDDAAGTVAIVLAVTEGPVFHMGDLEYRGLDNSLTAKLRGIWKLRPGDTYDATYLKQYLQEVRKLLPAKFDWDIAPHVTANARDKSVDVDLQFTVKAAQ